MTSPNRVVGLMSADQVRRVSIGNGIFVVPADALSRGYPRDAFVYSGISVFPLSLNFYGCDQRWSCCDRLGCSLSSFGRPSCLVAHSLALFIYLFCRRRFVCMVDSRNGLSILHFLLYLIILYILYYDMSLSDGSVCLSTRLARSCQIFLCVCFGL